MALRHMMVAGVMLLSASGGQADCSASMAKLSTQCPWTEFSAAKYQPTGALKEQFCGKTCSDARKEIVEQCKDSTDHKEMVDNLPKFDRQCATSGCAFVATTKLSTACPWTEFIAAKYQPTGAVKEQWCSKTCGDTRKEVAEQCKDSPEKDLKEMAGYMPQMGAQCVPPSACTTGATALGAAVCKDGKVCSPDCLVAVENLIPQCQGSTDSDMLKNVVGFKESCLKSTLVSGDMTITVSDAAAFLKDEAAQESVRKGLATFLGVNEDDTHLDFESAAGRRLAAGDLKVKYTIQVKETDTVKADAVKAKVAEAKADSKALQTSIATALTSGGSKLTVSVSAMSEATTSKPKPAPAASDSSETRPLKALLGLAVLYLFA